MAAIVNTTGKTPAANTSGPMTESTLFTVHDKAQDSTAPKYNARPSPHQVKQQSG